MYPALLTPVIYVRLHGLGKREQNYAYKYSDSDLEALRQRILDLSSRGARKVYILFNNVTMFDDALRFKGLLKRSSYT
jgi:uncharacterized protein YecE (DUF72 family)